MKSPDKPLGDIGCFNNSRKEIIGTIQLNINSGSSKLQRCTILLVDINTIHIMERDIMKKLDPHLTMTLTQTKGENKLINVSNFYLKKVNKWVFNKFPHLCTRFGCFKNHTARSSFKSDSQPTQRQ